MFGEVVQKSDSYARIINSRHFDRLVSYLDQGSIALGGTHLRESNFIEPTILVDVKLDAPVMQDEIFGPILPLIAIDNLKDSILFINQRPRPLALYIFSHDRTTIEDVIDKTMSGGVAINDCLSQVAIKDLPFGGIGASGIGHYHGAYGFETFSHLRAVYKRSNLLDNPIRYAPYSENKLKIAKSLL